MLITGKRKHQQDIKHVKAKILNVNDKIAYIPGPNVSLKVWYVHTCKHNN